MNKYIKIARIDHWVKNAFIIPGIISGFVLVDHTMNLQIVLKILTGFLSTCLLSSANYVINEWLDAAFDRFHPVKKHRPLVTQGTKTQFILMEYAALVLLGILLASRVNLPFLAAGAWLLVMGVIYNVKPFRTKDIPYLDVLSESVNNIIRLLLGWFLITAAYLPPASLIAGYWMAGAFLMGTKRLAEYRMIGDAETAGLYRKSFLHYSEKSLLCSSVFYSMCATFCLGIFMIKYRVEYVLAMPILFILFSYYLMLSYQEDSVVQKPEKLYREKKLLAMVFLFGMTILVLTFWDIAPIEKFYDSKLMKMVIG